MADEHEGGGFLHKKLFGLPLPVVLIGGGLVAFFVLAHRGASGGAAAAPETGPAGLTGDSGSGTAMSLQDQQQQEQLGYQTALDQLNLEAARFGLSQQEAAFGPGQAAGKDAAGHQTYTYGTGPISKAWQQVTVGGQTLWEDIYHPGHIINEQQAQQLAPSDHGPYASGANKLTLGNLIAPVLGGFINAGQQFASRWLTAQVPGLPVGLPNQSQPVSQRPAPPSAPATPSYTPPVLIASKTRYLG